MRQISKIDVYNRKDILIKVLTGTSKHINLPILSSEELNENLILDILKGIHSIHFDVIENKDGTLDFSTEEDLKYISSIANFYFNKYPVNGYYFKDLTGLEHNTFECLEVYACTLRLPYSSIDILQFQSRIR